MDMAEAVVAVVTLGFSTGVLITYLLGKAVDGYFASKK